MQRGHIPIMHRRKLNIVASSLTFHSPGTRCAKYRHDNKYLRGKLCDVFYIKTKLQKICLPSP